MSDAPAQMKNLREKLDYIQQNLQVLKQRGKGHDPKAGVTYEFRNAEDILQRAKPLAHEVRAVIRINVVPQVIGPEVPVEVRCVRKDEYGNETFVALTGPRFAAVATAYLMDLDSDAEISSASFAFIDSWRKGQTEPEKLSGSADSYASKYALGHLFALDNNKDADMESNERTPDAKPPAAPAQTPAKSTGFDF